MLKIANIVGARPQFIKAVMVSRAIKDYNRAHKNAIREILIHTGQHYDYGMSDVFFKELRLKKPDHYLGVGSGSHGRQTALALERLEAVLIKERPHMVIVYGDTNTTLAGALAAKKLKITVAHIEAGLRSFNRAMPEEINRVMTDSISDILFCPSSLAVENLAREGIRPGKYGFPLVSVCGDVMYDSILAFLERAKTNSKILKEIFLSPKGFFLSTIHRQENTDDPWILRTLMESLEAISSADHPVIFPAHPRTVKAIKSLKYVFRNPYLKIIRPVSYLDMLILESQARIILTDSGGVQKEAYFLKVPCVTLRNETEWEETVGSGCNILAGCDRKKILKAVDRLSRKKLTFKPLYGDAKASSRIVDILSRHSTTRSFK